MEIIKTTNRGVGQNLLARIETEAFIFTIEHGCHKRVNDHSWWLMARKVRENRRPRHDCVLARLPHKRACDALLAEFLAKPEMLATAYDNAHDHALKQDHRQDKRGWAQEVAQHEVYSDAVLTLVRAAVAADPSLAEKLPRLPPEEL
jgi:hypothetical protein